MTPFTIIVLALLILTIGTVLFFGKLLFKKNTSILHDERAIQFVKCHICKKDVDIETAIDREREAGIVHYYCGSCIEILYSEYIAKLRKN